MTSSVAELNDIQHDNGRGKGKASQHEGRVEGEAGGSRAALAAGEEEDQPQYNSHGIDMAAAYSSVSQIEATPFTDPETGEAIYPCPFCDKQYGGKHARSIWRRHLSNKHDIPLNVQPRRTRWDNGELNFQPLCREEDLQSNSFKVPLPSHPHISDSIHHPHRYESSERRSRETQAHIGVETPVGGQESGRETSEEEGTQSPRQSRELRDSCRPERRVRR